jgi:hypothetical protein
MEYAYTVFSPTDSQRHLAKPHHIERMEWTGYVVACNTHLRFTLNAMLTPLIRRVGSQYAMWPVPTCERCLAKYRAMVGQVATVGSK